MSKTIDQKVVEMQFDNRQFERNVSTTMSSIDKLKQSLRFDGASKSLENVSAAAKKVDMNGLASGVEAVRSRFSALEVMGVTALANITNSAVNAGKRIVSALTVDPIKTGFQEYETQLNAVQTILANTQSKGSTLEDVNAALNELNKYADQTVYNFTEMTKNIGTFTAAGVDLDKSVTAIKGIANLAAVSGSNSQQASTAMYQLSQALAAGRVSLMDWNSVVNAGMGGEVFQNALIRTARQMGTGVDEAIKKYGTFRESLTKGQWLTAEVLTETLTQISGAYTEAELIAQGYSKESAKAIVELADTAVGAATDVKTFTGMWETLKESVQSGWAQTWQILIGDFEEAKTLWTEVSNVLGGIVQRFSDARNALLGGALDSNWKKLTDSITEAGVSVDDFNTELEKTVKSHGGNVDELKEKYGSLSEAFQEGAISSDYITETLRRMAGASGTAGDAAVDMTDKLAYFQKVVTDVWRGDYKNGQERIEALTAAGYDYAQVQELVNKTVDGHALTLEDLTDVQLTSIGYTQEEITALRALADEAEKTGTPLNELIANMTRPSGRELLIDSFRNALSGLGKILGAVGTAWRNTFPPMSSDTLYSIIEAIHSFSEGLVPAEDTIKNLTRTLEGLFAIIDIITTITGGAFKVAFKLITTLLGAADMDILEFTALLGDAAVKLRDFLLENNFVIDGIEALVSAIPGAIETIKGWIDAFLDLPIVQSAIDNFSGSLSNLKEIGLNAIEGLKNGLSDGLTSVPQILINIGKAILDAIKGVLGIASPSTEMYDIGTWTIEGFLQSVKEWFGKVWPAVKEFGSNLIGAITDVLGNIDWGGVMAAGIGVGILYVAKQLADGVSAIASPFIGLGNVLNSASEVMDAAAKPIAKTIKATSNVLNSFALTLKAAALVGIAAAIGILAGSLFILSKIDSDDVWKALGCLAAIGVVVGGLSVAIGRFGGAGTTVNFSKFALALFALSTSLVIAAAALKIIESIDVNKSQQTMDMFMTIIASFAGMVVAYGVLVNDEASKNISKLGGMMIKMAIALGLMAIVIKLMGGLSEDEVKRGQAAITGFITVVAILAAITKLMPDKEVQSLGKMMLSLSASLAIMAIVMKLLGGMDVGEMVKGGAAILGFVGVIALLALINKKMGQKEATKLGGTLAAMAASMLIMTLVIRLLGGMDIASIAKGLVAVTAFSLVLGLMIKMVNLAEGDAPKIAVTLLAMSTSVAIMAGVAALLSLIDLPGLIKGVTAVGILSAFMAGMIFVTKYAKDVKGDLIAITVAVGVMALAIAGLSFIDPGKLAGATAAMGILMGMFALIVKSSANVNASLGPMIVMAVVVAEIAAVLYLISGLPVEQSLGAAASLSVLMLALAASMKIIGNTRKISGTTIAAMAVLGLVVGELAVILALIDKLDVNTSMDTVLQLSALMIAMSGVTLILSVAGKGSSAALQGALALAGVIAVMGVLIGALGALVTYFPDLETFLNNGLPLLTKIGEGIGSFFGSLIGSFMGGVAEGIAAIGEALGTFIDAFNPFVDGLGNLDEDSIASVSTLAEMLLILGAAQLLESINGLIGIFTGQSSWDSLKEKLESFGEAAVAFSDVVSGNIDAESVNAAANAGKALAELASNLPRSGGFLQAFIGEQDLGVFGEQLKTFGGCIVDFSDTVKGKIDEESVTAAANAGLTLANLAKNLPRQGGFLQQFLGEQDLGVFGEQLKTFGTCIADFSTTVKGKIDEESVTAAANAGTMMADLANNLPRQGGFLQKFLGEQDMGVFGEQLKQFGDAIVDFSTTVKDNVDADAVEAAKNAGMAMSELANNLPRQGGFMQGFLGEQDMATFGSQLEQFGDYFKQYNDHIKDVDPDVVNDSTNAAEAIVALANTLPENKLFKNETWLNEFGEQLETFGDYYSQYYGHISSIDIGKLSTATTQLSRLVDIANSMTSLNTSGMSNFSAALTALGEAGIDSFITAFETAEADVIAAMSSFVDAAALEIGNSKGDITEQFRLLIVDIDTLFTDSKERFKLIAQNILIYMNSGIELKRATVIDKFNLLISDSISEMRDKYDDFRDVGKYLADGLIQGINENNRRIEQTARNMAQTVDTSVRKTLDIHSPSEVLKKLGGYITEGLGLGIAEGTPEVGSASEALAGVIPEELINALGLGDGTQPSTVTKDLGSLTVDGVAVGITENTSAEEAIEQKAQAIEQKFQEELSAIDLSDETADLESQLAQAIAGDSLSELDQLESEAALLAQKVSSQTQRVDLAQQEYNETLAEFGQSSTYTKEAYNKLLQEQIDLIDLTNQLQEATQAITDNRNSFIQSQNSAYVAAKKSMDDETMDFLLSQGFTPEEIEEAVMSRYGVDKDALYDAMGVTVNDAVTAAMTSVEKAYTAAAPAALAGVQATSTNMGVATGTALGTGVQQAMPTTMQTIAASLGTCVDTIKAQAPEWEAAGLALVEGLAKGIRDNIAIAQAAARKLADAVARTASKVLRINSPSRILERMGGYVAQGLANGITDGVSVVKTATTIAGSAAMETLNETMSIFLSALNNDMDMEPTIRPVLDLSNVQAGVRSVNALLSRENALLISKSAADQTSSTNQNGVTAAGSAPVYQFTQNNYSPKALSRVEIYRQTRNQFSTFERMAKT